MRLLTSFTTKLTVGEKIAVVSSLITVGSMILSTIVFFLNLRSDVAVTKSKVNQIQLEVDELRRLRYRDADKIHSNETALANVKKNVEKVGKAQAKVVSDLKAVQKQ